MSHPLVERKLIVLRDKNTLSSTSHEPVSELVMLEAYGATRSLSVVAAPIEAPVAPMTDKKLVFPRLIIVPALRIGSGVPDGMTRLIPAAEVGFLGMKRDGEYPTQQVTYMNRLPKDLSDHQYFLISPMFATGRTLVATTHCLAKRDIEDVTCSLHASPSPRDS